MALSEVVKQFLAARKPLNQRFGESLERDVAALPGAEVPERLGMPELPQVDPVPSHGPATSTTGAYPYEQRSPPGPRPEAPVTPQEAPGTTRQASRVSAPQGPASTLPAAQEFVPEPVYPEAMTRMSFSRPEAQARGEGDPNADLRRAFVTEYPDDLGDAALRDAQERDRRAVAMADARDGFRHATSLITGTPQQAKVNPNAVAVEEFLRRRGLAKENAEPQQAMAKYLLGRKDKREDAEFTHGLTMKGKEADWKHADLTREDTQAFTGEQNDLNRKTQREIARQREASGSFSFTGPSQLDEHGLRVIVDYIKRTGDARFIQALPRTSPDRARILNALGTEGDANLPGARSDFESNKSAQAKSQIMLDNAESWERTGSANLKVLLDISNKIADTGSPWANKAVRAFAQGTGDPNMVAFRAAHNTAVNEYAKILSGATGSAMVTDSARKEAESMLPLDATPAQLAAAAKVLETDAANRIGAMRNQIGDIRGRISPGKGGESTSKPDARARMKELVGQGLSKEQAVAQMEKEGF